MMNQVSYVTVKGLRMRYSRTTAVQVSEGMQCYFSLHTVLVTNLL